MGSFQRVDTRAGLTPAGANARAWSAAVNLFYSAAPGIDLGIEYRHAERETTSAAGNLDRLHIVAKQSF
jgi:hypothetical protein